MQEYARQAKDTELVGHATEIKLRAERRADELLSELDERRGRPETLPLRVVFLATRKWGFPTTNRLVGKNL
jgi:hypothetical protein